MKQINGHKHQIEENIKQINKTQSQHQANMKQINKHNHQRRQTWNKSINTTTELRKHETHRLTQQTKKKT